MPTTAAIDVPTSEAPRYLRKVRALLGVAQIKTEHDLVGLVERRLPIRTLNSLRRGGVSDDEIYALVIPRRTLTHRQARREALTRDESDRLVRLARIAALGEAVFGERERAWRWLRARKRQFHDRTPLQLLATEAGARIVEELLYRIDEGMAA